MPVARRATNRDSPEVAKWGGAVWQPEQQSAQAAKVGGAVWRPEHFVAQFPCHFGSQTRAEWPESQKSLSTSLERHFFAVYRGRQPGTTKAKLARVMRLNKWGAERDGHCQRPRSIAEHRVRLLAEGEGETLCPIDAPNIALFAIFVVSGGILAAAFGVVLRRLTQPPRDEDYNEPPETHGRNPSA